MPAAARPHPFRERLRRDSNLFLELEFCATGPIPHSAFKDWSPIDQAKALAHFIEKSLRCQLCGTAGWEWERDRFAYEPALHECIGCYMRESMQRELDNKPGVTVTLSPTKSPEALARKRTEAALRERDRLDRLEDGEND